MNPKVDFFFNKVGQWHEEYEKLRTICLGCGLTEELKWGQPCYTLNNSNIVLIHGFKEYCALLVFKGALLSETASPSTDSFKLSLDTVGTSPATLLGMALYSSVSGVGASPLFPATIPRHVRDSEAPSGVTAPRPVITTRRIG